MISKKDCKKNNLCYNYNRGVYMGVIKCPKCGNILSDHDTMCMNCSLDILAIKHELKENSLVKEGIIDKKKKKNTLIVVLELSLIFIIATIYVILFVPKIIEIANEKPIIHETTDKTFDELVNEIE